MDNTQEDLTLEKDLPDDEADEEEDIEEAENEEREEEEEEQTTYVTQDGQKIKAPPTDGIYELHHDDGRVVMTYKAGKKNGESLTYNAQNILFMRVNFLDDTLEGPAFQYYPDGKTEMSFHYKKGVKNGPMVNYYPNQMKRLEVGFLNDQMDGTFTFYDEYGDISQNSTYKMGILHGPSTTFFPKSQGGEVCRSCVYENGLLVKEDQLFYTTGELLQETPYDKGRALAYPVNYDQSGNILKDPANKNRHGED